MRLVSFYDDGRIRPGILEGAGVNAIDCDSLIEYIALPQAERRARGTNDRRELEGLRLAAPVRPRKNVFCVGRNYVEHAKEGARAAGRDLKLPDVPTFFTKAPTAIADPGAILHFSADLSQEYDWEAELAIVIGVRARDISENDAPNAIFGFTCLNDITARNLQRAHLQWFKGKSLDESCPIGPWIVTADELGCTPDLHIELRVSGVEKQSAHTGQTMFSPAQLIAQLSKGMTLEPGDVIATGTPEGVGFARTPPEFLSDGDVVEVEIEGIGILRNTIRIA